MPSRDNSKKRPSERRVRRVDYYEDNEDSEEGEMIVKWKGSYLVFQSRTSKDEQPLLIEIIDRQVRSLHLHQTDHASQLDLQVRRTVERERYTSPLRAIR